MTTWTVQEAGRKGGRSRSPRKVAASRKNARKASATAGRKQMPEGKIKPASLKRRERREAGKS